MPDQADDRHRHHRSHASHFLLQNLHMKPLNSISIKYEEMWILWCQSWIPSNSLRMVWCFGFGFDSLDVSRDRMSGWHHQSQEEITISSRWECDLAREPWERWSARRQQMLIHTSVRLYVTRTAVERRPWGFSVESEVFSCELMFYHSCHVTKSELDRSQFVASVPTAKKDEFASHYMYSRTLKPPPTQTRASVHPTPRMYICEVDSSMSA